MAAHDPEARFQRFEFFQQLQGQCRAGEIDAEIVLQAQRHRRPVQVAAAEAPAMPTTKTSAKTMTMLPKILLLLKFFIYFTALLSHPMTG